MKWPWPRWRDHTAAGLLLLVGTVLLSVTGVLSRIDNVIYDAAQQNIERVIPSDVVLVTIDEQSLSSLGRWPWSRRLHARLIDRLHADGARVIGMDIMFTEPQKDDPQADILLASAMARAANVVLPVVIEKVRRNGQLIETLPSPILAANVAAMGRAHAELDADAMARSILLWEGLGHPVWPHFSQAMLTVAQQLPGHLASTAPPGPNHSAAMLVKHDQRYINFSTGQRQLPSLSYAQVLNGEFAPGTFRDKLVLVGSTASGMADSLPTPVSGFRQPMPGVEFLANALISMRSQTLVRVSPLWLNTLLAAALALLPMLWLPHTPNRIGVLASLACAAVVLAGTMVLPLMLHVWVPLSAGLLGLLSAYPIWAWCRLETASHFLDEELSRLQQELGTTHANVALAIPGGPHSTTDPFVRRIAQVRLATAQLRQIEQTQRETMAFVSHDIRVPLASAAAQIQQDLGEQHPAYQQLMRALAWTEDFLQTSRAQMLREESYSELDVIALLHQVCDDIYPLTRSKSLQWTSDLPDGPVWVRGHFETLMRAMANLLSNALKFSPPGGHIQLRAQLCGDQIHMAITDDGPGIAQQDMDRLFKRFSRLEPQGVTHAQTGVGLGLYFVQTTLEKHGGSVQVSSRPGQTTFTVILPVLP